MCEVTFIARSRDGLILVETYDTQTSSNNKNSNAAKQLAKQILKRISHAPDQLSIDSQNNTFYYITREGVCYMTVCSKTYPKTLAFAFLDEIRRDFEEELKRKFGTNSVDYRSMIETIEKPYYFIKFDKVVKRKNVDYRDPKSSRALSRLNESLIQVTSIMRQNIGDMLERGSNLEDISRRADDLKTNSKHLSVMARKLSYNALLQKYMPLVVFGIFMLLLLFYIIKRSFF